MIFSLNSINTLNSDDFEEKAVQLLEKYYQDTQDPAYRLLNSILFYLERKFFQNLSDHLQQSTPEHLLKPSIHQDLDSAAKGKIRYVSGFVIAKLKHNVSKKIRNLLFAKWKENDLMCYQNQMEILNSLGGSYAELSQTSSDKSSLEEIRRKQNKNEGLTNVSDLAFSLFSCLEYNVDKNS